MANGFERHGIKHLSASALNTWRSNPALWGVKYLFHVKDDGNPAIWRGVAVEAGVDVLLRRGSFEDAFAATTQTYEANALGDATGKAGTEREALGAYLRQAQAILAGKNQELVASQLKTELWFDEVPVPVVGYIDYLFEDGSLFDLKTTERIPSSPRPDHCRQIAGYMKARNTPHGSVLYVSDKKAVPYPIEDAEMHLESMRNDAISLGRFLDRMETARDAVLAMPFDLDNFKWGEKSKAKLKEILRA